MLRIDERFIEVFHWLTNTLAGGSVILQAIPIIIQPHDDAFRAFNWFS